MRRVVDALNSCRNVGHINRSGRSRIGPPVSRACWLELDHGYRRRIVTALDPAEGSWLFGTMAPGWHITTRPAVTLFEPSHSGRGRFALESEIFLFPGPSDAGFGLFIGGRDLESKGRLVAFLIRRDGSAAVESHDAGRITLLRPWTKAASILPGAATGDDVKNVLRVEAEATS